MSEPVIGFKTISRKRSNIIQGIMIAIIIPLVWYFTDIVLLERYGVPTWEFALINLAYALIIVLAITMCIKSVMTTSRYINVVVQPL